MYLRLVNLSHMTWLGFPFQTGRMSFLITVIVKDQRSSDPITTYLRVIKSMIGVGIKFRYGLFFHLNSGFVSW